MFKIAECAELNHISLTGARALVLIGLLSTKPRSMDDIRRMLLHLKLIDDKHSNDTLRIDLNTIKAMGCEISRPLASKQYKYILTNHPFSFKPTDDEINVLKKVYNHLKTSLDLHTLMEYDELFKKIAFYICDETSKESMLGISVLKYYDLQMIKDLLLDCKQKRTLELIYNRMLGTRDFKKEVIAQELVLKNDKLYLYGFDLQKKGSTVLNLRRIKTILTRKLQKRTIEPHQIKIKFMLNNLNEQVLNENEEIIEVLENGFIVEGYYHNNFLAMQRMLYFGKNCIVLGPDNFREKLIEKLKEMRKIYE